VKSLEVRVPHGLEKAEVRQRLNAAVERARREYADKVSSIEARWETEDRLNLDVVVLGMDIHGDVEVEPAALLIQIELPGMMTMFAGQIRSGIEERIGGLLGAPA
jgi:hypothetical protein